MQVTACDPETKASIEAAGGSVTRVYYEEEGLRALLHVSYDWPIGASTYRYRYAYAACM